ARKGKATVAAGKLPEGATCGAVRTPYAVTDAPPKVRVGVGSRLKWLLVDTGADRTIVKTHDGSGRPGGRIRLLGIGGVIEGEKWDDVELEYKGTKTLGTIVVLPQSPVEVLGRDNMQKVGISLVLANLEEKRIPTIKVKLKEGCSGPHIPQWPLTREKLEGLKDIVDRLEKEGKVARAPPERTWNTPIFCIKKKSGKWRMLIDFRELNRQTEDLAEAQLGLPHPGGLQQMKNVTVLDIGDAYFTIPLYEPYQKYTCFTLLAPNNMGPCTRYYWKVLPQGWKLSPAVYQFTMQEILRDWIVNHPKIQFGIYMDDIYIGSNLEITEHRKIIENLAAYLLHYGFTLPEDKRQEGYPASWLGYELHPNKWKFQKHKLPALQEGSITLNKLQKIVGDLVWRQSLIGKSIPNILKLMEGDRDLHSERILTQKHVQEWKECQRKLEEMEGTYYDPERDIYGQVDWGNQAIEHIVFQEKGKPLWVNVVHSIKNMSLPQQLIKAAQKLTQEVIIRTGRIPWILLPGREEDWLLELQVGNIIWMPTFWSCYRGAVRWRRKNIVASVVQGPTYYTDGGKKNKVGSLGFISSTGVKFRKHEEGTNQQLELRAIEEACRHGPDSMNIVTDSRYAYEFLLRDWEEESIINPIQARIMALVHRKTALGVHWVPGHKGIPQNEEIDKYISEAFPVQNENTGREIVRAIHTGQVLWIERLPEAEEEHWKWHQDARSLQLEFGIPRTAAEDIVKNCEVCQNGQMPTTIRGGNVRGVDHWQVDYTHYKDKILLVWVETNSGMICAERVKGESGQEFRVQVIKWVALFQPKSLQSDNGPAFVAEATQTMMKYLGIQHSTGIPWNPQSQALVERAHKTLKNMLEKLEPQFVSFDAAVAAALISLNIKRKGGLGTSPMDIFRYNKEQQRLVYHTQPPNNAKKFCYYRLRKRGHPGEWNGPTQVLWEGEGAIVVRDSANQNYLIVPYKDAKFVPEPKMLP
ncbi:pol polyprotein, partial [Caprine arthritis encephalitis virus Roccaverano]